MDTWHIDTWHGIRKDPNTHRSCHRKTVKKMHHDAGVRHGLKTSMWHILYIQNKPCCQTRGTSSVPKRIELWLFITNTVFLTHCLSPLTHDCGKPLQTTNHSRYIKTSPLNNGNFMWSTTKQIQTSHFCDFNEAAKKIRKTFRKRLKCKVRWILQREMTTTAPKQDLNV